MEIPKSIEQATERLNGLEALLVKAGWARSAIVAAFVRIDNKPGPQSSDTSVKTPVGFAALGISGLKSHVTVRHYVEQWLETHDGKYPEPGEVISDEHLLSLGKFPKSSGGDHTDVPQVSKIVERHGVEKVVAVLTDEQKTEVVASIAKEQGAEKVVAALDEGQKTEVAREVIRTAEPTIVREVTQSAQKRYDDDHEKFAAARKASKENQETEHKQAHTLRYVQVEALLDASRRKLRDALTEAQGVSFSDDEHELLVKDIDSHRTLIDLFSALLTGTTEVDWDAELQKIGA